MLTYKKITQVINRFAVMSGGKIDKLKLIKLIYFTDKYHLRKYGRTVINSEYWAMDYGPVAETAKDIIDDSSFLPSNEASYRREYIMKEGNYVATLKQVNEDYLSDSEIEAIDFVWSNYGNLSPRALVDATHEYPEWKKHESRLNSGSTREKINIEELFSGVNDTLSVATSEFSEESRVVYEENKALRSLLNDFS